MGLGTRPLGPLHALLCHWITSDVIVFDGMFFGVGVLVLIFPGNGGLAIAFLHPGLFVIRLTVFCHEKSPRR